MSGRKLYSESEAIALGNNRPNEVRRRQVLRETIQAFERANPPDRYHRLAMENLTRWRAKRGEVELGLRVTVLPGDWGDVTLSLTRAHGACFAVLNMANEWVPGGAYTEGAAAQEENMFRRTDCHFRITDEEYDADLDAYRPRMTRLLWASDGVVYLDTKRPRVCIRGSEDQSATDLGYPWLPENRVFPFFELRAAAQDLRDGSAFDPDEARQRISAQLDTLINHGIRHCVLGAFGCGAFMNPADRVARIYRDEITARRNAFTVVAFAIYSAGYGPDNYPVFAKAFHP